MSKVFTMTTMVEFGSIPMPNAWQRLRLARETTGLDTKDFAEEIGVSRQSIMAYERGAQSPRPVVLRMISLRTGVSLTWLETGEAPSPDGDGAGSSPQAESNRRPSYYKGTSRDGIETKGYPSVTPMRPVAA